MVSDNLGEICIPSQSKFGDRLDYLVAKDVARFKASNPVFASRGVDPIVKAQYYSTLAVPLADAMERVLVEDSQGVA